MSTDFVDAVLNGDLEVAGKTIEEGSFPVEDVDRPLGDGGGTALIAASQRGLTRAVHFLLEKGADLTLSNYMDQTALHLSGPDLQGELLEAASRCPSPQVQLLYAAWWGDLHSLQSLLVQKEQVDVNIQNQDGLTPLMLAVRDVDLFEALETQMTWEYRPVEVVKELLAHHAALAVYDQRGHCALYYAALLKSRLREELIQLFLESFSQPELTDLYPHCCEAEELPTNSPDSQLTRSFVIENAANTEDVVSSAEGILPTESGRGRHDKRISLSFHTARETLRSMRKEYRELEGKGSGGTSLPSLWDNGRQPDKPGTLDTGQGLVKMKGHPWLPSPPKAAEKKEAKPPSLNGPHAPQLTQSSPILTQSLLDTGSLLRVRAQIQTRLGRSEPDTESHSRRQFLPSPLARPLRTPKLLEPLACEQRNKALQLACSHLLPRPQGLLPLTSSSKAKRERLTWRAGRGPHRVRGGGSVESSSSSVSSQGSLDLEEEEQEEEAAEGTEDIRESTGLSDNQPAGSKGVPPATEPCESLVLDLSPSFQPFVSTSHDAAGFCGKQGAIDNCMEDRGSIISCADKTPDCEVLFGAARSELAAKEKKCNGTEVTDTEDAIVSAIGKGQAAPEDDVFAEELAELELSARPMRPGSPFAQRNVTEDVTEASGAYNLTSHSNADTNHLGLLHVVNITVSESNAPLQNNPVAQKTNLTKERGNAACFRTNQSFNILAYKDHSRFTKKSKNVQRSSSRGSHLKSNTRNPSDLTVSGEATAKQCVSRTSGSKANRKITTAPQQNRSTEQLRPATKRPSTDRGITNKLESLARKPSLQRDLKCTRQPKKIGLQVMPRSRSAVDFVTYSDMFQEIKRGDQGPAIYEMFASPVFDNLRGSTSWSKVSPRQVQSAPARKLQGRRNQKHIKTPESSRQKKAQKEKLSLASRKSQKKGEALPSREAGTPLASEVEEENVVFISGLNWHVKTAKCERVFDEAAAKNVLIVERQAVQDLSVIDEVLSHSPSDTLIHHAMPGAEDPRTSLEQREMPCQEMLNDQFSAPEEPAGSSVQISFSSHHKDGNDETPELCYSPSLPRQPKRNTWTSESSDRTLSPMFRKYLDAVGEGPLTDDLLQSLAKELISLEDREVTIQSESRASGERGIKEVSQAAEGHPVLEGITSPRESDAEEMSTEGAILWTKGEVLGRGAYGTVYCGLTDQGQLIAVKQVTLDDSHPGTAAREYQRLQEEVDLLKTLRHMHIVGFLGTTLQENVVSIFMEYVPGGSIASIIHRFGPLPEKVLALYTQQIVEGVAYLHENRVIHRDLKGNNVMLMPTGVVKLIDFGCARRISCLSHSSSSGELLRSVHGTPFWMAPEVINETGHGRKSDIWSIGCTVFEMATGRPPLAHMDKMAALFYIGARRGLMPTLPDAFSENARNFVQACLTSDQRDRPSAQELLQHPFFPQKCKASSSSQNGTIHGLC